MAFTQETATLAFYYEIVIGIGYGVLLALTIRRYREKKSNLAKLLVKMFSCYGLALFFSIISKWFNAVYGGVPDAITPPEWLHLVGLLHSGRFGQASIIVGTMFAYELQCAIFEGTKKGAIMTVRVLGIVVVLFQVLVYQYNISTHKANMIYNVLAFLLSFLFMILVYFPFMWKTFHLARRLTDARYKGAITSLGLMSFGLMATFFMFLLDQIMLIAINWAYSIFYYLAWVFILMAIITSYLGYILPASRGHIQQQQDQQPQPKQ